MKIRSANSDFHANWNSAQEASHGEDQRDFHFRVMNPSFSMNQSSPVKRAIFSD
jgi:hypothetical protein